MSTCPTCSGRGGGSGLLDLLLVWLQIRVQGPLAQLLQVASRDPAEALQRQAHVLLPDEQSLHNTFGGIQQIREGNLDGNIMTEVNVE